MASPTPLPTPPTTAETLPLPLPVPLSAPPPTLIDPAILHPLYTEIDRLREVVDSLQSRIHGLEGVLSFVLAQSQAHGLPHPSPNAGGDHRPYSGMVMPMPSPPEGFAFYPTHPPHRDQSPRYPLPAAPHDASELRQPLSATGDRHSAEDPVQGATGLRLANVPPYPNHPAQLPPPSIPTIPHPHDQAFDQREVKRTRNELEKVYGETRQGTGGESMLERATMRRRGSSSLEKILSPLTTAQGGQ